MKTTSTHTTDNYVPAAGNVFFHGQKIPRTWVVVADHGKARIYQKNEGLELIANSFPDAAPVDIDAHQSSGRVGRTGVHFAGDPRDRDNHHTEAQFIRDLAQWLEQRQNGYDRLVLVADPRALGEMRKFLCPGLQKFVSHELPKNLTAMSTPDLERYLEESIGL